VARLAGLRRAAGSLAPRPGWVSTCRTTSRCSTTNPQHRPITAEYVCGGLAAEGPSWEGRVSEPAGKPLRPGGTVACGVETSSGRPGSRPRASAPAGGAWSSALAGRFVFCLPPARRAVSRRSDAQSAGACWRRYLEERVRAGAAVVVPPLDTSTTGSRGPGATLAARLAPVRPARTGTSAAGRRLDWLRAQVSVAGHLGRGHMPAEARGEATPLRLPA